MLDYVRSKQIDWGFEICGRCFEDLNGQGHRKQDKEEVDESKHSNKQYTELNTRGQDNAWE